MLKNTAEYKRLLAHRKREANWRLWGCYLSERAWGTVREDYSEDGEAWTYFPHDHARSRAYRWNEDGLMGISDRYQHLCFALALWNGQDAILKERLFGLSGKEGNHGEDVKEYYFYLDNTPTHSYMKMLYKYPQSAYPYADLIEENQARGLQDFEYELMDTGIFDDNRYFDVQVEYAKADQDDILIQISVTNRAADAAPCHILPTLWFRNTWSWGYEAGPMGHTPEKPSMQFDNDTIIAYHPATDSYYLYIEDAENVIFTENETNTERLFQRENQGYTKDAFHHYIVNQRDNAINPDQTGTKAAALYSGDIAPGETRIIRLRLSHTSHNTPFKKFDTIFKQRLQEADDFYAAIQKDSLNDDEKRVQRQAFAGMLWTKQLYYYDVEQWLKGDPQSEPPKARKSGRNSDWRHLNNFDVISMPDKWEYPWYAAWDLAFHAIPLAMIDPDYAKRQLELMTREWYMHPNGQLPAYEWKFSDVNPPVHAWAAWRVFEMDAEMTGEKDVGWLKGIFMKMLLNFTWWVNRKDADGNNLFQGGFLGLDNISLFDRSELELSGVHLDQSDGTAWMAFFALGMVRISLELAKDDPTYQDMATKFYEHFLAIARAISEMGGEGNLWDEEDGFFYDALHFDDDTRKPVKVRSLVGLMPLIAVEVFEPELIEQMATFERRLHWFTDNRPHLAGNMMSVDVPGQGRRIAMAILTEDKLRGILRYLLDEDEFLSPYGIRSLSKFHEKNPYNMTVNGEQFSVKYVPAESESYLFGGNSNWRGPVWFPINYLLIEALRKFHRYYGDDFKVACPTGSDNLMTLDAIADDLSARLTKLFLRDEHGRRPVYGGEEVLQFDPEWCNYVLFHEYFHGDNGAGLGASHQTGWTGIVAELLQIVGGA